MRWQGRDANRKLQRAIKAGKARERLPALVAGLGARAAAWAEAEGRPFLWDGEDFQARHHFSLFQGRQKQHRRRLLCAHLLPEGRRKQVQAMRESNKPLCFPNVVAGTATVLGN